MVAAVPLALPAAEGAIALASLLAWAIVLGMLFAWNATFHWVAVWFNDKMHATHLPGSFGHGPSLGRIGDAVMSADKAVIRALSDAAKWLELKAAMFLDKTGDTFRAMGSLLADTAESMAQTYADLYRRAIPRAEDHAVARALRPTAAIRDKLAMTTTVALPRIRADADVLGGRVGHLEDIYNGLRAKLREHSKLLTGAGITALTMVALRTLGLGRIRCPNIRRNLKRFCGVDPSYLDEFLTLGTLMLGTYSLVQFAEEMQEVVEEVGPLVRHFWRAD